MPGFLADALTWPEHHAYLRAVQTAAEHKFPPTTFILQNKQPTDPWTMEDKKLAMAFTILNKETCNECGQPLWICRSSNKDLLFKVRTDICYAKAEMEKWQKKNTKLKPGQSPYIVAEMRKGQRMPSRETYITELMDE